MNQAIIKVRNYQATDFHKYILLQAEVEKLEPTGRCVSPQFIAKQLGRPDYCPEQDLFIAEVDKRVVGYIDIERELAIGRVVLDCRVHPEHRRRGLARELFDNAIIRARELGAKAAHVNVGENNETAGKMLSRLGFTLVRRFLELRLDIGCVDGSRVPTATECCYLRPGEEQRLTELQNRAFAGTWGYNPNTVERMTFRINSSTCSRDDIMLIYDRDRAIGCCWTGISCEEGIPSVAKGRIHMLGVDPDHRRKGIGRELVMAGLTRLKDRGLRIAELTVDSENKAARALYESLGFEVRVSTLWQEKVIS
jgi:mycothiol synthase